MKKVRRKLRPTEIGVIKTFSLSPDDEVGEIAVQCSGCTYYYNNLRELCEGWEDYEEPKKYWFIDAFGNIIQNKITKHCGDEYTDMTDAYESQKQIGNYFETEEEAEKVVEKLKAWKRLEDKGFRFYSVDIYDQEITFKWFKDWVSLTCGEQTNLEKDLDLLFGGEE